MALYRGVAPVYKPGVLATGEYPQNAMGYTDQNRCTAYVEVFRDDGSKSIPTTKGTPSRLPRPTTNSMKRRSIGRQPHHRFQRAFYPDGQMEGPLGSAHLRDNGRVEFWELGLEKENV